MAELRLEDLGKTFAPALRAFDEVTFTVASGECLAIVGPSGCGKTTLLRVIAGLESATDGDIFIDNVKVNDLPSHRRDVALLSQRPAFLWQQTVRQNLRMAWTLREPFAPVRRWLGADRAREAELVRIACLLGLAPELERPLGHLSGGQQQRVALGRCLMHKAKLTLLDEPLGHLDAPMRTDLRRQIRNLARELGLTVLHVTHDPEEALAVGDRVAVMRDGRILQIDEPRQLRRCPGHRFVAELIHHEDGGFNWLPGVLVKEEFEPYFESVLGRWPVSLQIVEHLRESLYRGEKSPEIQGREQLSDTAQLDAPGTVENFAANPEKVDMMIGIPAAEVRCTTAVLDVEDLIRMVVKVCDLECSPSGNWVIGNREAGRWVGQADEAERFERGQEVNMAFAMNRAYFFDSLTGRTLYAPAG